MSDATDDELEQALGSISSLMEPCEKCGKIVSGARLCLPTGWEMPLCFNCHQDSSGFVKWFESELEAAIIESGEYERMPDGTYRRLTPALAQ